MKIKNITITDIVNNSIIHEFVIERLDEKGYIMLRHNLKKKELYIDTLYVYKDFRNQGIGTELLEAAINTAIDWNDSNIKEIIVSKIFITYTNPNNKRLYLKLGFKQYKNKTLIMNLNE